MKRPEARKKGAPRRTSRVEALPVGNRWRVWLRWGVYVCAFLSGVTSLVFEVLWSRQFVTVFGNSACAVSVVLCAYMTGLGLGGLLGG
jgi:predicted membrane-bound spermidine synthase